MKWCTKSPTLAKVAALQALIIPLLLYAVSRRTDLIVLISRTTPLSQQQYYLQSFPPIQNFTHNPHQFLSAAIESALNETDAGNTVNVTRGISVEGVLGKHGYLHNDQPEERFCPPMNTPDKPACLTVLRNAYFGQDGTVIQPSTGTVFELGGGCCVKNWRIYLNKTVTLPKERRYEGKVVMVLNGHHSVTYHHVLYEVIPRYLMFLRLLEEFPDVLVSIDRGYVAIHLLKLLGLDEKRVIITKGGEEDWSFASVLLFPPPVFQHAHLWFGKQVEIGTSKVISHAVGSDNSSEKVLVLLERAKTREENGECHEQRCARNFEELKEQLEERFEGVLKVVVYKALDKIVTAVRLFSSARLVVGVHGGGFQNIAFCEAGTTVVHVGWGPHYKGLAEKFGLKYYLSEMKNLTTGSRNVTVDVDQVMADVERAATEEGILTSSQSSVGGKQT